MSTDETFDVFEDDDVAEAGSSTDPSSSGSGGGRKRLFGKELRCMMYGFGDDINPYTESVELLEDVVIEFITQMTQQAMEAGRSGRVTVEDVLYLVRRDTRKAARVLRLLDMNEELRRARRAFDEGKYATG